MTSSPVAFIRAILRNALALVLLYNATPPVLAQSPFQLTDSDPSSPEFRERFLASYGVNSEIEPSFRPEDRVLYESIRPYLVEDPQRAIREVQAALGSESNPAFRFLLGNLHYELGNLDEAEQELLAAIKDFPDFRRAYRTLGLIQIQNARFSEAINTWLKVITLGGGDAQSYGLLGYAYLSERKYHSALSAYRMARMFKPDGIDFRRGEAHCLMETGEYAQASALLNELIAERPEDADYWLLQANIFLQMGQHADAINNLEIVHSLGIGSTESRFMLGDLHLREDNHRLALLHYESAIKDANFGSKEVSRALRAVGHLIDRGLIADAQRIINLLKPSFSENLSKEDAENLKLAEARIHLELGSPEAAQTLLKDLTERNPLNGRALILLSELYQQAGDIPMAIVQLERAIALPDHKVDAHIAYARLEVDRNNWQAALDHLRIAQQLQPRPSIQRYIESIESVQRRQTAR